MIKSGLLGAFFVVSSIAFAQELTVKSYSLSFFEEAPKPNESFTDVEDPFELRIPWGGFRAWHSSDPFGGAFGDPFGGGPFGDAEASTNAPPTGMDMGDKAIRTFNLLGAAVPETSRAVNVENTLFLKTTDAAHARVQRLFDILARSQSSKLNIEVNATFVTFPRDVIASHPELRQRGSLSQAAVLALWREGKGTVLAQQKIISPETVNNQVEGVEEIMYPSDLMRPPRTMWAHGQAPAFSPGAFETREQGANFNCTPYKIREGVLGLALLPGFTGMAHHDGHVISRDGKRYNVLPPFESMDLSTSLAVAQSQPLVQGGATLARDRIGYIMVSADHLDTDGKRMAPPPPNPAPAEPSDDTKTTKDDNLVLESVHANLEGVAPKEFLEILGMPFPEGASAMVCQNTLHVINHPKHMHILQDLRKIDGPQVEVDATFVRFTVDELRKDADFLARGAPSPGGLVQLWREGNGELVHSQKLITFTGVNAQFSGTVEICYPSEVTDTNVVFESREIGMILNVTPTVHPNEIELAMIPEIAVLDRWLEQEDGSRTPIFASHNITSTVSLRSGGITALGGNTSIDPDDPWVEVLLVRAAVIDPDGKEME